jgi:hypothetical protein
VVRAGDEYSIGAADSGLRLSGGVWRGDGSRTVIFRVHEFVALNSDRCVEAKKWIVYEKTDGMKIRGLD